MRVRTSRTVISFWVSVPVLSEQIVDTEPSVSTAAILRVIARRWAICCTPSASVMVTSAGRPSGIAATAKPMVAEMSSRPPRPWTSQPTSIMKTPMPRMSQASVMPNLPRVRASGVWSDSASLIMVWMRPISVFTPVPVTTAVPVPATTSVPENSMEVRSRRWRRRRPVRRP